jgi:hypothetical protein
MKVSRIRKAMQAAYENGGILAGKHRSVYVLRDIERFCALIGTAVIYEYTTISKDVSDILSHYGIKTEPRGIGYGITK